MLYHLLILRRRSIISVYILYMTRRRRRTRRKRREYRGGNGKLRADDFFEIIAPMVGPGNPKEGDIWHVMDTTGHHIHAYRVYPSYGAEAIFGDNLVGRRLRKIKIEHEPGRGAAARDARPSQGRRLTWGDGQSEGAAAAGLVQIHDERAHDDVVLRSGYAPVAGGLQPCAGSRCHRVTIPAGLTAGSGFLVDMGTHNLKVQVPAGMGGGQTLDFAAPSTGQHAIPLIPRVWRVNKSSAARRQQHQEIHTDIDQSCPAELLACRDEYRRKLLVSGALGDDFVNGWTAKFNADGKQPHECLGLLRECREALRRYQHGGKKRKTRRRRRRRRRRTRRH